jgi:hypothetical protein
VGANGPQAAALVGERLTGALVPSGCRWRVSLAALEDKVRLREDQASGMIRLTD